MQMWMRSRAHSCLSRQTIYWKQLANSVCGKEIQTNSAPQNHSQQKKKNNFCKQENSGLGFFYRQITILDEAQIYGLVNKSVESLVLSKFGQDTWDTAPWLPEKTFSREDLLVRVRFHSQLSKANSEMHRMMEDLWGVQNQLIQWAKLALLARWLRESFMNWKLPWQASAQFSVGSN